MPAVKSLYRLENLSRKFQLLLCGKSFVELFHISIINVIPRRRLVHAGDTIKISMDKFLAEKEGVICAFRQVVIAYAEFTGIGKAALPPLPWM